MNPALEIRHLRMIQALVEEGSLTRAGERLGLTQSALSHQLRNIEDRLGVRLFNRSAKSLHATAEGCRLLGAAEAALELLIAAEHDVRRMSRGLTGALRISTACYTCYHWLPQIIAEFHRIHPGVELELALDATRRPVQAVLDGRLDIAITDECVSDERLLQRPLFTDEIVALMRPDNPLAGKKHLRLEDFADAHLLVHNRDQNSFVHKVLKPAGVFPRKVSDVQMTEGIRELAKAGIGVAVMARWAATPDLRAGALTAVKIRAHGLRRKWNAVFIKDRRHPDYVWKFLDLLKSSAFDADGLIATRNAKAPPRASRRRKRA